MKFPLKLYAEIGAPALKIDPLLHAPRLTTVLLQAWTDVRQTVVVVVKKTTTKRWRVLTIR